jgi:hypothetical protein
MSRKQEELPNTRRDDEPKAKSIKALDDACTALEKAKGKASKAGQDVNAAKQEVDRLLRENRITAYLYENLKGVECRVSLVEKVKTEKVKTEKTNDEDGE